jgi:hypothetical protein
MNNFNHGYIYSAKINAYFCWVPVTHACNPSYSGGRDQEYCSSKPAQVNSWQDPILKNPSQKAGATLQGVGSEFKPQNQKKMLIFIKRYYNIC